MNEAILWKRDVAGTEILLVPGDPFYEHLKKTNPKKLERLMHDEMKLYAETHAPDYPDCYHEMVQRARENREWVQKRGPDYKLLGLDQYEGRISRQRVVSAYRRMAKELHPDVNGSHEAMVELTNAYQRVLAGLRDRAN